MEQDYKVVVIGVRGEKMIVDQKQMKSMTVRQLWGKIPVRLQYSEEGLILGFQDTLLEDNDKLLSDYGIQHMSVIHMFHKLPEGGGPEEEDGGTGD